MVEATGATPEQGGATPPEPSQQGDSADTLSDVLGEAGLAALERERTARRDAERELKRLQAAETARSQAELTETQRQQERIADLERQLSERTRREQEQSLRLASITAAQKLGYRNPDIAYRLLDTSAIEFDESGAPTNVEKMLEALAKSDPYLLVHTDFGGGVRGESAASERSMNSIIRRAAGKA